MNKSNEQNAAQSQTKTSKTADETRKSEPTNGAPPYSDKYTNKSDSRQAGQQSNEDETGADDRDQDDLQKPGTQSPAQDPMKSPSRSTNSNDDMSRQQGQAMPGADEIKGKWKQQVGAAKIAWGKLTEDELLKVEGQEQKLAGLVQERYAITRDEADKQVKNFFSKQH